MIAELRGEELAAKTRIVVVQSREDCRKLSGLSGHVAVDHAFYDFASTEVVAELSRMLRGIQATQPASAPDDPPLDPKLPMKLPPQFKRASAAR